MTGKQVFLIGPGFIGSEVLDRLVQERYEVTALVRRHAYALDLQKAGASTVIGTLDDKNTITQQTVRSDVVVHTATADHLPSVEAVLDGITRRADSGKSTIFIHTSGATEIADDARGEFKGNEIFSDNSPRQIDAVPDSASHREIDLAIVRAREKLGTKAKLAIMIPPLIYGVSSTQRRLSIQLPTLARFALKHGYAGHVGKGLAISSQVHVSDLARAYLILLRWLEGSDSAGIYENPYFFCENGMERSWGECAVEIGRALHKAGRIPSMEPRPVPQELYDDLFGMYTAVVIGSNMRTRGVRLRDLGWVPLEKSTFESLSQDEIPILLQEKGKFNGYAGVAASGSG